MGFPSRGFEEDAAGEAVEEDEADEADDAVAEGTEDEGDTGDLAAQGKTVFFMIGPHSEAVPRPAVVDI